MIIGIVSKLRQIVTHLEELEEIIKKYNLTQHRQELDELKNVVPMCHATILYFPEPTYIFSDFDGYSLKLEIGVLHADLSLIHSFNITFPGMYTKDVELDAETRLVTGKYTSLYTIDKIGYAWTSSRDVELDRCVAVLPNQYMHMLLHLINMSEIAHRIVLTIKAMKSKNTLKNFIDYVNTVEKLLTYYEDWLSRLIDIVKNNLADLVNMCATLL